MPHKKRDDAVAERFGRNLRRERRREGLTQEVLAKRAGLHRTEIGRLESGERVPKIDTLIRLADSAGTTTTRLLDGIYWLPASEPPESIGTFTFSLGFESTQTRSRTQEVERVGHASIQKLRQLAAEEQRARKIKPKTRANPRPVKATRRTI